MQHSNLTLTKDCFTFGRIVLGQEKNCHINLKALTGEQERIHIQHTRRNTMRTVIVLLTIIVLYAFAANAQHKYVGAKTCKMCHQTDKQGKQFDIWQKSKHAEAFKTLSTPKAAEVAKARGLKKGASESPECLECHAITADAKLIPDGVQCESCHGAGSDYKNMAVMKDKAKAVAAGLTDFKDNAAMEKACKSCHNAKSPSYKGFKFEEMWAKIRHPIPKG
jgi:hypothetical protein